MEVIRPMPYWLETDTFADDDVWTQLTRLGGGRGRCALYDRLKASYCDLKAIVSRHQDDGWLTEEKALYHCRGQKKVLKLLCTPVLGRPPLVHPANEECECRPGPLVGHAYYIHEFLKRNPAKKETQRNRAQRKDLDDARLKTAVYERDGGCCRYCRSGPINKRTNDKVGDRRKRLHFDHVDPDAPAGPDGENFVTACASCNEHKGHHLPKEVGMVLLAEPTPEERVAWLARPLIALFDRSDWGPEHAHIIAGSSPTSSPDHQEHHHDATDDVPDDADDDSGDDATGVVRPDQHDESPGHQANQPREGPGSGRVGKPMVGAHDQPPPTPPRKPPEAQPVRSSANPDIYHRRSRASPPDLPPYRWPPGSVPAEPRRRHQDPDSSDGRPPWT